MTADSSAPSSFWRDLLAVAGIVALLLWFYQPGAALLQAWLSPRVQTSAPDGCRAPTEHETLLISVGDREGWLRIVGCSYAAGKGTYYRSAR